jgi:Uncharacterized conserved protein
MLKTLSTAAALAAAAGAAFASDGRGDRDDRRQPLTDAPRAEWMSVGEVARRLESQGYVIREIDTERGAYEVEATDANGMRVEAYVHPVTGAILPDGDDDR